MAPKVLVKQTHVFDSSQQSIRVLLSIVIQESKFCFEICRKLNSRKLEKEGRHEALHSPSTCLFQSQLVQDLGNLTPAFLPQIFFWKWGCIKEEEGMRSYINKHRNKYISNPQNAVCWALVLWVCPPHQQEMVPSSHISAEYEYDPAKLGMCNWLGQVGHWTEWGQSKSSLCETGIYRGEVAWEDD